MTHYIEKTTTKKNKRIKYLKEEEIKTVTKRNKSDYRIEKEAIWSEMGEK